MGCKDTFDKYDYVYSCCADSIDGISIEFLKELYSEPNVEGAHIMCCKCYKVYHLYKLGMKWTEEIATHEDAAEFRKLREKIMLHQAEPEPDPEELVKLTLADIPKFICKVCKKGLFDTEPLIVKEAFVEEMNKHFELVFEITKAVLTSVDDFIEIYNKSDKVVNYCRPCARIGKERKNVGKYN